MTDLRHDGPMVGPARRRVLADEVADAIRNAIFSGRIDLGQRLVEEELASNLNVSRGPCARPWPFWPRKAWCTWNATGGQRWRNWTLRVCTRFYSLRTALERLAAECICRYATQEDFDRITAVLQQFDKLPRPLTRSSVAALDLAFHDAVFQAAHHERLYRAWLSLRSQIFLYLVNRGALRHDFAHSWLKDHQDLLEVLARQRRGPAVKLVEAHIEGPYQRVLQANLEPPDAP